MVITWASCEASHPTKANYFTVELKVLKEMSQELAVQEGKAWLLANAIAL